MNVVCLALLYTHPFSLPAFLPGEQLPIKACVYWLEKGFSNAVETSWCYKHVIIENSYLAYRRLGIYDRYSCGM